MPTPPAASPLESVQWFPPAGGPKPGGGLGSTLLKLAVSAAVGFLFFAARRAALAYVVWGVGGTIGVVSIASAKAREAIDGALVRFGGAVGHAFGVGVLAGVYLVLVTPLRFVRRVLGADDLHLRDGGRASFWLPADADERKVRWIGSMFATEARPGSGHPVRTAVLVIVALFGLSEGILRTQGFGHAVLYVADPEVGYYPEPNVDLARYGGEVRTNNFGMRSPDVTLKKPPGTFRILMIGDSTLYGGSYIDQRDLYASRVREHLNALGLPGPVEVLAMGCNGWGPFHEHGVVKRFGAFDADLTLVQMPIDDVNRPLYGLMSVPFFAVQSPPRLALEEVANHLMWRYRSEHSGLDPRWEEKQAQHGIKEYGLLADDLKKAGSEVMVFVLPERDPGFGGEELPRHAAWRAQLEKTVGERGVTTYFARGFFRGRGAVDAIYHDNVHLNPKGHHAYAEYIEAKIQADSERFKQWAGRRAP